MNAPKPVCPAVVTSEPSAWNQSPWESPPQFPGGLTSVFPPWMFDKGLFPEAKGLEGIQERVTSQGTGPKRVCICGGRLEGRVEASWYWALSARAFPCGPSDTRMAPSGPAGRVTRPQTEVGKEKQEWPVIPGSQSPCVRSRLTVPRS